MKTVILTHSDCDGICAGAIALSRFPHAEVFFTRPASFAKDLRECVGEEIIICDIAFNQTDKEEIMHIIKEKPSKIIYFDHHPMGPDVREFLEKHVTLEHNLKMSASELIYKYYQKEIPEERVWIAIYGAIGDYCENTQFVKDVEKDWDIRALYFEVSTLVMGIKTPHFEHYDKKRIIVREMSKGNNPSDIPGLVFEAKEAVKREFELYDIVKNRAEKFDNVGVVSDLEGFGFRGPAALFAATATNSLLGISVYDRTNHLDITVRTRNYKIDLNILLAEAGVTVGGNGGGHPEAGGARIPMNKLKDFINFINKEIGMMKENQEL
ncbi:MAG: DHH family phosphoesterase [Candidatus Aenigmarchaeota archaeon]|nr:DHH family phosphoesterase [Candidatus Aenigmarchaeota archaeon]